MVIREQYHYDLLNPTLNTYRPYIPEEERKEHVKKNSAKHYQDNRDEILKRHAKYKKDNREKIKELYLQKGFTMSEARQH